MTLTLMVSVIKGIFQMMLMMIEVMDGLSLEICLPDLLQLELIKTPKQPSIIQQSIFLIRLSKKDKVLSLFHTVSERLILMKNMIVMKTQIQQVLSKNIIVEAGKSYDIIILAEDINNNGESQPGVDNEPEIVIEITSGATGVQPRSSVPDDNTPNDDNEPGERRNVETSTAPSQIRDIEAVPASSSQILVTWSGSNPDQNVTRYDIFRSVGDDDFSRVDSINAPRTQFVDSGLDSAITYQYKVRAENSIGDGPFSDTVNNRPGNPSLRSTSSSNIVRTLATESTIARSDDALFSFIATPQSVNEATNNNSQSVVSQVEVNDSSSVAATRPLSLGQYQFISPKTYRSSLSRLEGGSSLSLFDNPFKFSLDYSNDDVNSVPEDNLTLAVYNEANSRWTPIFTRINSNSNTVEAKTRQLGFTTLVAHNNPRGYEDVFPTSPFAGYIGSLTRTGVVSGNGNRFLGDNFATRAELIKMKIVAEGYQVPTNVSSSPCPDVSSNDPFAPFFRVALDQGIINGFNDGSCGPSRHVTRAEALKIIFGDEGKEFIGSIPFSDFDAIPVWAKSYVAYGFNNQIVSGFSDNTFRPDRPITRNEISKILYEAVSRSF